MTILFIYHAAATGGVGSYLLNLGSALTKRGHRVLAAVPDGDLASRLEHRGLACHRVRIEDWRLPRAARELDAIVRREGVQIVHAHDHSAGAAAFLAARRSATPYLLTIHCRRPFWQRFVVFYWSPRVITVSPSLRDHLIHCMGLQAERVVDTAVGIDVERFSDAPVSPDVLSAVGLAGGETVLLHVSRLSATKSWVALSLVKAAPRLVAMCPALVVLIVGGGEHEAKLRKAAARVNRGLARDVVRVLGPRDDVPELLRSARVVVGTATVVLEAMASGRPAVAAGKYGFVGTVTPATFAAARETFFGDHGPSRGRSRKQLEGAVMALLRDDEACRSLGKWGRETIAGRFGLAQMAIRMEEVYAEMSRSGGAGQQRKDRTE
jgi:glycosyltransferase involved in cell wall biosynthesis